MGRLDGKVALITGAARGQGRSHAIRLAEEGADIIAIDICDAIASNVAKPSTLEDLATTVRRVEEKGRRTIAKQADVRSYEALSEAVTEGVEQLGRLDIVCANAGVWTYGLGHELGETEWRDVIDIVLTGVWLTCKATIPQLLSQGEGGSVILTSSVAGSRGFTNVSHYVAAKHGVVGLMRSLANELAPYGIRVNVISPANVDTDLIHNEETYKLFAPDLEKPTRAEIAERFAAMSPMGIPWISPEYISAGVAFLASDEARYVNGSILYVDAGVNNQM